MKLSSAILILLYTSSSESWVQVHRTQRSEHASLTQLHYSTDGSGKSSRIVNRLGRVAKSVLPKKKWFSKEEQQQVEDLTQYAEVEFLPEDNARNMVPHQVTTKYASSPANPSYVSSYSNMEVPQQSSMNYASANPYTDAVPNYSSVGNHPQQMPSSGVSPTRQPKGMTYSSTEQHISEVPNYSSVNVAPQPTTLRYSSGNEHVSAVPNYSSVDVSPQQTSGMTYASTEQHINEVPNYSSVSTQQQSFTSTPMNSGVNTQSLHSGVSNARMGTPQIQNTPPVLSSTPLTGNNMVPQSNNMEYDSINTNTYLVPQETMSSVSTPPQDCCTLTEALSRQDYSHDPTARPDGIVNVEDVTRIHMGASQVDSEQPPVEPFSMAALSPETKIIYSDIYQ